MPVNASKVGLALGTFAALVHLVWAALVGFGAAQPFMSWVYGMHFLDNPFTVQPFALGRAVLLIVIAFVVANIVGWILGTLWNWVHKK